VDNLETAQSSTTLHISPNAFALPSSGPQSTISPTHRESPGFVFPTISPTDINPSQTTNGGDPLRKRSSTDIRDITDLTVPRPSPPGRKKSQSKPDFSTRLSSSKDYPRRRALQACQICRARKTKCDNERPTCGSCEALGVECNYNEAPASKFVPLKSS
jgi:hypothetical protein